MKLTGRRILSVDFAGTVRIPPHGLVSEATASEDVAFHVSEEDVLLVAYREGGEARLDGYPLSGGKVRVIHLEGDASLLPAKAEPASPPEGETKRKGRK